MKKVLCVAILATLFTTPALADETFVLNQWKILQSRTKVNLNIDSTIYSTRNEDYSSSSSKISFDNQVPESLTGRTINRASSYLNGSLYEENTTRVFGTVNTITNSYTRFHESSAGVR
jgi:hypothetical protein